MRFRRNGEGKKRVTLIYGDGIGREVVSATRKVIDAAGVPIAWEEHEAGADVFRRGLPSGVPEETIQSIRDTRVALKGPLETPVGFGEKSANVTLRKLFETFANIRPVREMPGVRTRFSGSGIDLVIVRENVEDLYAGIEHMQTPSVAQCLKLVSREGCEKIVRTAFELARAEGRRSVHCATKANIMKFTEGLLKEAFERIAPQYPEIAAHHIIVDNCAHQLVRFPETFDVIVTSNMNGDILSDLTSGLVGGLGFAPGANLGSEVAIFEAVHGSAPKYAGKDVINPAAVLLSGLMMLRHLDEFEAASSIEAALYATLEAGIYTRDVRVEGSVGTNVFADAIIARLGAAPRTKVRDYKPLVLPLRAMNRGETSIERSLVGVDVFVESNDATPAIAESLSALSNDTPFRLKMISNRGTQVFPDNGALTHCVDHFRCRFVLRDGVARADDTMISQLLSKIAKAHRWMHVEKLQVFEGKNGFTKAQGEN